MKNLTCACGTVVKANDAAVSVVCHLCLHGGAEEPDTVAAPPEPKVDVTDLFKRDSDAA